MQHGHVLPDTTWVMLQIAGQLRRGGDLTAHFEAAFRAYLRGWKQ